MQDAAAEDGKTKKKPSLLQRMLRPVAAVRKRYRSVAKVVSAFNKATLIPSMGTMMEKFMKTSLFKNTNALTKIAVMNYEKFGERAKELLNAFTGQFGLLFWAIGKALQPFKWFVSTTWNAVMHPIDTLKKVINGEWLVGLLKRGFDNPANAFMFGALAAMVYNFVERYVFPVVDHYVIIPALRVVRNVMRWLDPDSPGTVAHAIMGFVDLVKHPIEFLRDLVKPVDGVGNSLVLKVFMNLAKKVGVDFPLSFAKLLFKNADVMLKTMVDLKTSPFLSGFAGSARMSWLLKPMMFAAMAAGNALGKIYKTDGDQDGRLSFSERITKALGISKAKVTNAVVGKFMKAGMSAKELEAARGNIDALDGELNALLALDETV